MACPKLMNLKRGDVSVGIRTNFFVNSGRKKMHSTSFFRGKSKMINLIFILIQLLLPSVAQSIHWNTSFQYSGTMQTYTVPAGVEYITVCAAGAQGGRSGAGTVPLSASSGLGGLITATVAVTPFTTLYIFVGGVGENGQQANDGGFNGGGRSNLNYDSNTWGGSGGGASDVRTIAHDLHSRLVVAGGGGGVGALLMAEALVAAEEALQVTRVLPVIAVVAAAGAEVRQWAVR